MADKPDLSLFNRVPNTFIPEREVFLNYWLPLIVGPENADGYKDMQLSILDNLFPDVLDYGPHVEEAREYFTAFAKVAHDITGNPTKTGQFRDDAIRAYLPEFSLNNYTLQQNTVSRNLSLLVPSSGVPHLPRMFELSSHGPEIAVRHRWSRLGVRATNKTDPVIDAMGIMLGLICLQYAYLGRIIPVLTPMFDGRTLVRSHNKFCREWGLPELQWAHDNVLGLNAHA